MTKGMTAMGVDVSLTRGHGAVLMDESGAVLTAPVRVATAEVGPLPAAPLVQCGGAGRVRAGATGRVLTSATRA